MSPHEQSAIPAQTNLASANDDAVSRWVAEWRRGVNQEENFRRLFEFYYRPVCRFFEKRGFSPEQARDLTQETFIGVYKGIAGFRGESAFQTWLFLIAANIYRNTLRHEATQKRAAAHVALDDTRDEDEGAALELADADAASPLDAVLQGERARVLREAMAALPEQMRKCVVLRVHQELSYQEIAVVLRLSVETVRTHLKQARKQLKAKLAGYFDDAALKKLEEEAGRMK